MFLERRIHEWLAGISTKRETAIYFPSMNTLTQLEYVFKQAINTAYMLAQYDSQSFSIASTELNELIDAFKAAGMYGFFGFSELANDMMYMA